MALLVEGNTDSRFLSTVVRRTVEYILGQHSLNVVYVSDPQIFLRKPDQDRAEEILHLAGCRRDSSRCE